MKDGMFVFDNVVHMYDNRDSNVVGEEGQRTARNLYGFAQVFSNETYPAKEGFLGNQLSVEEAHRILFEESDTDMAMAQAVPLFGWWKDGFSPARLNHEFAAAYPEKVVFCGAVDPLFQGLDGSLREMERQVNEMGARSMKFYQAHAKGLSWRTDDRKIAYPLWEKALELGITSVQFHKGVPFGTERMEDMKPNDLQGPAEDFPELTFIIHHLGDPYIDESISIAARNQNVWMALSAWINVYPIMPVEALHRLGKALMYVGPDRLLWGSEAFIWPSVKGYVDLFAEVQIPEEMQDGYGYPAITDEMRAKMFGLNQARLLGIDVDKKITELYGADAKRAS